GPARLRIFMGTLSVVCVFGKVFSSGALANQPAYHPVFSWEGVIAFQRGSLADLLCWRDTPGLPAVVAIWVILTFLAWRGRSPLLRFCWVAFLITPIPLEFIENRFQGCLYIPMAFLAIFASAVLVEPAGALA